MYICFYTVTTAIEVNTKMVKEGVLKDGDCSCFSCIQGFFIFFYFLNMISRTDFCITFKEEYVPVSRSY